MSESFTAPGAQRKQLLIVGTVFGVLALAAALWLMMIGGGNTSSAASILAANAAAKTSAASPGGVGAYSIPAEYAGNVGHDPFKPAVVAKNTAGASAGTVVGGTSSSSPTTSSSPSPTKTPIVTLTPTPSPTVVIPTVTVTPSPTGLPTASTSQTLTLLSVDTSTNTASVTVVSNGTTTPYTVQNGKVFGTYFKLVSILTDSTVSPATHGADFQYGDQFIQLNTGQSAQLG